MITNNRYFIACLSFLTIALLVVIFFDLLPQIRGTAPYPPEWQWPYFLSNTITKIWAPLLTGFMIIVLAKLTHKHDLSKRQQFIFLISLIFLGIIFQISLLFYSRAGIPVLLHRILDPEITSYFAASLNIQSASVNLHDFNAILPSLPLYAKYHPPFGTILFSFITSISEYLTPHLSFINQISPTQPDVAKLWNALNPTQKIASLLSGFFLMILSTLSTIPLYFAFKELFGQLIAKRSAFFFLFIPSVILFVPMNDVFMPLFTSSSLYFFLTGLKKASKYNYLMSGIILSFGALFSITFLPITIFFLILGALYLYSAKNKSSTLIMPITTWSFGFLLIPFSLFLLYGYNLLETIYRILMYHISLEQHKRYLMGLFYAPFDFFLFLGIPLSILAIFGFYRLVKNIRDSGFRKLDADSFPVIAFWAFLFLVTISGSVRFESARIWTPFIPLALLVVGVEMKKRELSKNQFLIILLYLLIQVILFQTVLVTVW